MVLNIILALGIFFLLFKYIGVSKEVILLREYGKIQDKSIDRLRREIDKLEGEAILATYREKKLSRIVKEQDEQIEALKNRVMVFKNAKVFVEGSLRNEKDKVRDLLRELENKKDIKQDEYLTISALLLQVIQKLKIEIKELKSAKD